MRSVKNMSNPSIAALPALTTVYITKTLLSALRETACISQRPIIGTVSSLSTLLLNLTARVCKSYPQHDELQARPPPIHGAARRRAGQAPALHGHGRRQTIRRRLPQRGMGGEQRHGFLSATAV